MELKVVDPLLQFSLGNQLPGAYYIPNYFNSENLSQIEQEVNLNFDKLINK